MYMYRISYNYTIKKSAHLHAWMYMYIISYNYTI